MFSSVRFVIKLSTVTNCDGTSYWDKVLDSPNADRIRRPRGGGRDRNRRDGRGDSATGDAAPAKRHATVRTVRWLRSHTGNKWDETDRRASSKGKLTGDRLESIPAIGLLGGCLSSICCLDRVRWRLAIVYINNIDMTRSQN